MAPYKKPESDAPDNTEFNHQVSMLRIWSEHAIGFLKGRFQSLKSLRLQIKDEKTHKFATYWIVACIALHTFVMKCEQEGSEDADSDYLDPFVFEGQSSDEMENEPAPPAAATSSRRACTVTLAAARRRHEQLKRRLFRAREMRAEQRRQALEDST